MLSYIGEKTKIKPNDCLFYEKRSNTVSFSREGAKIYFQKNNIESDKKIAPFIKSEEDFSAFATFFGNLICLSGEIISSNEKGYVWKFTHHKRCQKQRHYNRTKVSFDREINFLTFMPFKQKMYPRYFTPFIKTESDFDDTLIIVSEIFDCQPEKEESENPEILIRVLNC